MEMDVRQARIDLAAALRLAVHFGYHEAIANHFSLAIDDKGERFLLNPWGLHFSEVRASDLLVVDNEGNVLEGDRRADVSAACLHGPMHARLPQARCILHTHMRYATALASVEGGRLEAAHQSAARFYDQIAYDDDFNALALESSEGERVCRAMGNKSILFMANHGVMVTGRTVAEAFDALYFLEKACENQVTAMSTGLPLRVMPDDVARRTAEQWTTDCWSAGDHFDALKRMLDREQPDYLH
jgi:ribulose-5-phosphate 4-epimerase/fuculose-1-phosphate aldolase